MMLDRAAFREALSHYSRYGYAVVRGVFSHDETVDLAAAFDRHWAEGMAHTSSFRHGNLLYRLGIDPKLGKVVRLVQWPSYADTALERVRRDPRMFEILEPLLGRDIKQIINQLHWKPPGAASANFAYHQDARFRRPRDAYRKSRDLLCPNRHRHRSARPCKWCDARGAGLSQIWRACDPDARTHSRGFA